MHHAILGDRYELKSLLGQGGAAEVWKAWDLELDVPRAIKILTATAAARKTMRRRLKAEAQALARLQHPHVLRVLDIGVDDGRPYLVMDLLEGGSVSDRVRLDGPLEPARAITISLEVLSALAAAHGQGIVHRDIKPQNILLDADGRAVVADFGIALVEAGERKTRTGVAMGSFAFMPPEQRVDAKRVGPPADLYALGCTLFWMITGRTPVDLFTDEEDAPRWERVPDALRPVLRWATRAEPEERPQSAAELVRALRVLAPGEVMAREALDPSRFPVPRTTLSPTGTDTPAPITRVEADTAVRDTGDVTDVLAGTADAERIEAAAGSGPEGQPGGSRALPFLLLALSVAVLLFVLLGVAWRLQPTPEATPAPELREALGVAVQPAASEVQAPADGLAGDPEPLEPMLGDARSETAPAPLDVPAPDAVVPTTVAGRWTGSFDGHPMDVTLTGAPDALTGTVRVRLRGNAVDTPVRGRWDPQGGVLTLEDAIEAADAGRYRASLREGRLHGTFESRYREDSTRVLPFTLRPVTR